MINVDLRDDPWGRHTPSLAEMTCLLYKRFEILYFQCSPPPPGFTHISIGEKCLNSTLLMTKSKDLSFVCFYINCN